MFDFDDEFFSEDFYMDEDGEPVLDQTKAESIIRQAADDLQAILSEKVKKIIQQAKEAKTELEKIKRDIFWNQNRAHEIEKELHEAEQKVDDFEKYKMPAKYIQAFVREATGFYAPGDKVFYVKTTTSGKECPFCNGTRKINVQYNGETITVEDPHCMGYGRLTEEHYEVTQTEINDVRLILCFNKNRVSYWNTDSVFIQGREYSIKPEHLFKTREEAEVHAKELEEHEK